MAMNKTDLDHASNKWGFFVVFTLVALLIAVVLAFVGGRSLTQSQIALNQMSFQQQELKRLEILINDLPGGVAFVEVESGMIVRCNEAFRSLMGMTSEKLIGKSINSIIPQMYRSKEEQVLLEDLRAAWDKYGQDNFTLTNAELKLLNGKTVTCLIKIRGTRIGGRREWMMFIDPRLSTTDEADM